MRTGERGLSTVAFAVSVVIVVVVAAGAFVLVFAPSKGASSIPSTSSTFSPTSSALQASSTKTITPTTSPSTSTSPTTTSSTSWSFTTFTTIYETTYTSFFSTAYTTTYTSTSSSNSQSESRTGTTTATSSTTTCPTTTTSTSLTSSFVFNFTSFFAAYSEMAVHFNGTANGNYADISSDYHVLAKTPHTFKVNVTLASGLSVVHFTDYVWRNGTAAAVYYSGYNYTGFGAFSLYLESMDAYLLTNVFGFQGILGQLSNSTLLHTTGTGSIMLGPTKVNYTDYAASFVPLVENTCGNSFDLTKFNIQIGTIAGEQAKLVTGMAIAGSFSSSGISEAVDLTLHVTSITKAA